MRCVPWGSILSYNTHDCFVSAEPTERNGLRAWQFCEKKSQIIEIVYKDQENKEEVLTKIRFEPNLKVLRSYL